MGSDRVHLEPDRAHITLLKGGYFSRTGKISPALASRLRDYLASDAPLGSAMKPIDLDDEIPLGPPPKEASKTVEECFESFAKPTDLDYDTDDACLGSAQNPIRIKNQPPLPKVCASQDAASGLSVEPFTLSSKNLLTETRKHLLRAEKGGVRSSTEGVMSAKGEAVSENQNLLPGKGFISEGVATSVSVSDVPLNLAGRENSSISTLDGNNDVKCPEKAQHISGGHASKWVAKSFVKPGVVSRRIPLHASQQHSSEGQTKKSVQQLICGTFRRKRKQNQTLNELMAQARKRNKVDSRTSTTPGPQRSEVEVMAARGAQRQALDALMAAQARKQNKVNLETIATSRSQLEMKETAREQYVDDDDEQSLRSLFLSKPLTEVSPSPIHQNLLQSKGMPRVQSAVVSAPCERGIETPKSPMESKPLTGDNPGQICQNTDPRTLREGISCAISTAGKTLGERILSCPNPIDVPRDTKSPSTRARGREGFGGVRASPSVPSSNVSKDSHQLKPPFWARLKEVKKQPDFGYEEKPTCSQRSEDVLQKEPPCKFKSKLLIPGLHDVESSGSHLSTGKHRSVDQQTSTVPDVIVYEKQIIHLEPDIRKVIEVPVSRPAFHNPGP